MFRVLKSSKLSRRGRRGEKEVRVEGIKRKKRKGKKIATTNRRKKNESPTNGKSYTVGESRREKHHIHGRNLCPTAIY